MKNEYDILKVFAILLVVVGHVTALYTPQGNFHDMETNPILTAITRIIYIFHMPLFIALSGAIFEYGVGKGKYLEFKPFLKNKVRRIIVPYLFVGIALLTPTLMVVNGVGVTDSIFDIYVLGGSNSKHLWYLGAIFWCFIFAWIIEKLHVNHYLAFVVSIVIVMIFSAFFDFNYLQIRNGLGAMPSFLFGMNMMRYEIKKPIIAIILSFIIMIVLRLGISFMPLSFGKQLCCILLSYPIIMCLFIIAKNWLGCLLKSKFMCFILKNSFPIYLFHVECIYLIFYYFRHNVDTYFLIPMALVLSISVSIIIALVIRKCKIGFLIGE